MKRVCIPYALFKNIEVEITNDLNLEKLLVKPENKKYWHYSEIIGKEEYRRYMAMVIANILNTNNDTHVLNILNKVYDVNSLEELKQHCEKLNVDYSTMLTNVFTLAKNEEIQKLYNNFIDRFEKILKDNINYIYFGVDKDGNKIEDEVIK